MIHLLEGAGKGNLVQTGCPFLAFYGIIKLQVSGRLQSKGRHLPTYPRSSYKTPTRVPTDKQITIISKFVENGRQGKGLFNASRPILTRNVSI